MKYYKKEEKVVKIAKSAPREVKSKNIPQKLSYKYARLLEVLPTEIKDLEQKIVDLEKLLADPHLYSEDNDKLNLCSKTLEEVRFAVDKKIEQWIEVDAMQEELINK